MCVTLKMQQFVMFSFMNSLQGGCIIIGKKMCVFFTDTKMPKSSRRDQNDSRPNRIDMTPEWRRFDRFLCDRLGLVTWVYDQYFIVQEKGVCRLKFLEVTWRYYSLQFSRSIVIRFHTAKQLSSFISLSQCNRKTKLRIV